MATNIGDFIARLRVDVGDALDAYTKARQAHLSTVSALGSGAGALTSIGAGLTAAGAGLAGGLLYAAKAAGDFERKLDYFSAVSDATQGEYEAIRNKALQLGADTIYTADQIGDSFVELAKSGVGVQELLAGIGDAVANLGAATDMPLADAATSLTTILNTFAISAEDAVGVVDKLAGAANSSSIDVQDLILTMTYAGASAKTAGISFEDINAAIALLGERGIKGSKAGTGLRQVIDKLIAPTNKGAEALKELGIMADDGSSKLRNMDGTLKPLPQLLDILNGSLEGMTQDKKMDILGQIFPITSLPTVLNLIDGGSAGLARLNDEINKTTAMEIAGERLDNLSGDIEYLTGDFDVLVQKIGELQQSMARDLVQAINDVVNWLVQLAENDPALLNMIVMLAQIASAASIAFGGLSLMSAGALNMIQLSIQLTPLLKTLADAIGLTALMTGRLAFAMKLLPGMAIVTAIGLIVGALVWFFTQTSTGQALLAQFMATLQRLADAILPKILPFLEMLGSTLAGVLSGALGAILPLLAQLAGFLGGVILNALTFITPLFDALGGVLSGGVATGGGILAGILQVVAGILQAVLVPLLPIINQLLAGTAAAFAGVGQNASGIEGIGALVGGVLAALINMIPVILTAVVQLLTLIITAVVTLLPTIITSFITAFTGILTAIIGLLPTIVAAIISLIQAIITALVSAIPLLLTAGIQMLTGLIQAFVTIVPILINAVLQLVMGIVQALVAALPMIIQAGITLLNGLIQAVVTIIPILVPALISGLVSVIGAIVMLIPQLLAAAIQLFTGLLMAIPQILPPLIIAVVGMIPTVLSALIGLIPVVLQAGIQLLMALIDAVSEILPMLIEAVTGLIPLIIDTLISLIPQLLEAAIQLFEAIVTAVPTIITGLIGAVINLITTLVPTIIGLIPTLLSAAYQLFLALVDAVPRILGALNGAVMGLIGPIVNWVISMGPQLMSAAREFFLNIGAAIPGIVGSLVANVRNLGTQMIQGLIGGITNMARSVIGAVQNVVGGAIDAAKSLLGIHSPSRVFRGFGVNTIAGMIIGMQNMAPKLDRQMNMVADNLEQFYDQVYAAREFDVMSNLQSQMTSTVKIDGMEAQFAALAEQLTEIAAEPKFHVDKIETNNPVPEPESESTPKSIRKLTTILG